jgi:glycosyltransferase involved in cell wall biosynthesis
MALLFLGINIAAARISYQRICNQVRLERENRQLVQHLREEKEKAEKANQEKSRFLAAASHDLRQPMHALGLFIHTLSTHELDGNTRKLVENIRLSSASLEELFDALLDISRLEAGTLKPEPHVFSLGHLLQQITREFAPEAAAKGLEIRLFNSDIGVYSDQTMLGRIMRNAVSNAVRYTSSGGVLIGWHRLHTKDLETFLLAARRCPEHRFVLGVAHAYGEERITDELCELARRLESPAEIRIDLGYEEAAELTMRSGIYVHTHGVTHSLGMPISPVEAMASGSLVLARHLRGSDYVAAGGLRYDGADPHQRAAHVAALVNDTLTWSDERWAAQRRAALDAAWSRHPADLVANELLATWQERFALLPD